MCPPLGALSLPLPLPHTPSSSTLPLLSPSPPPLPQELEQVEDEVKKIQNNVRGWLLRKNYVNLREAAKTLQGAWRVKRRCVF